VTESERQQIPVELEESLLGPWPDILYTPNATRLHSVFWLHPSQPRESVKYLDYELPRYFSWIYPFKIAGMSTPRTEEDADCLDRMGITDLLSLNKEGPLPAHWFRLRRIKHHQVMLDNYTAPTCAEMDVIWDRVSAGGSWVIHCGGGVGRAGTVLACLITMMGMGQGARIDQTWKDEDENEDGSGMKMPKLSSDEAIRLLRRIRPKSLESEIQVTFVSKWVSHRWKLYSTPPPLIEPSSPLTKSNFQGEPLDADGSNMDNIILFLIGKPGSGKSFFSELISKRRFSHHNNNQENPTIIISQDGCGSREMCEKEISSEWPLKTLLIFDRCNPSSKDRRNWSTMVPSDRRRRVIAIYFDYDKELCRQRIDERIGHPTIRAGRGVKALEEMSKIMEPPTLDEGFSTIIRINSFLAAKDLVVKWLTKPIPLRKFPRTPHYINTGASTTDDLLSDIFSAGKLEGKLTIEEKIDGANLGISFDSDLKLVVQNRSHLIHASANDSGQFKGLNDWLEEHSVALTNILFQDAAFPERYILYGEWCHAKHSIHYTHLDDLFLVFDLHDRVSNTDCARGVITRLLRGTGIAQVPLIKYCDSMTREEVMEIIQGQSAFIQNSGTDQGRMEGVYIRFEDPSRLICRARGKIVRSDFIAVDAKHWSKSKSIWNRTKLDDCIGEIVRGAPVS